MLAWLGLDWRPKARRQRHGDDDHHGRRGSRVFRKASHEQRALRKDADELARVRGRLKVPALRPDPAKVGKTPRYFVTRDHRVRAHRVRALGLSGSSQSTAEGRAQSRQRVIRIIALEQCTPRFAPVGSRGCWIATPTSSRGRPLLCRPRPRYRESAPSHPPRLGAFVARA